jgi:hypothetical protein
MCEKQAIIRVLAANRQYMFLVLSYQPITKTGIDKGAPLWE